MVWLCPRSHVMEACDEAILPRFWVWHWRSGPGIDTDSFGLLFVTAWEHGILSGDVEILARRSRYP
jgi:hypothetical protein